MSTNLQKGKTETKLIRVKKDTHKWFKITAATESITISELVEKIREVYLKNNPDQKSNNEFNNDQ